jgi:Flp pilus assembly protein TadG
MQRPSQSRRSQHARRRGAATVEFAVTLPVFLLLLLGMVEMGSAINSMQTLHGAIRDAGRLASMDYKEILGDSTNPNTKIIQDIRNLLTASGIPGNDVTITIVHAEGSSLGQTFDLASDANYLKLFTINASVPYASVSTFPLDYMGGANLTASVTFRMGRVSLVSN